MSNSIRPVTEAWDIIERALTEAGLTGPPYSTGLPYKSRAEELSKAILARLAANDPPIIVCYATELDDLEEHVVPVNPSDFDPPASPVTGDQP